MIADQRHLFDIDEGVTYLNCAYTAPLLRSAALAGRQAIEAKANPWQITPQHFFDHMETVRSLFARMIQCPADCVAIVPSVSYGIALAARNVPVAEGQSIVVLQDQFPSNVYAWRRVARQSGGKLKIIPRPAGYDWTRALLEGMDDRTAVVAVPNCHWTDGTVVDLARIGEKCRQTGAALVVDGTQSLGAMPFSIPDIQPDFVVTTAHKWLLGPYSFGFCYVAPQWHDGTPLEENWLNRSGSEDFSRLVHYQDQYQPGARRFDMGEASNFINAPIAAAALTRLLAWGIEAIADTLQAKTRSIAAHAQRLGMLTAPEQYRAPHMIGITHAQGFLSELPMRLAQERVFVSLRGDTIRISPHLFTSDADIERLFAVLATMA